MRIVERSASHHVLTALMVVLLALMNNRQSLKYAVRSLPYQCLSQEVARLRELSIEVASLTSETPKLEKDYV